ncbi:hypothetical protein COLO4_09337 [Corchorus olitorius]|uniref:PGG domain-containing protein n=1 Tax=Corchorus olitorius TaxID=93759 RepID=A0A1R3KCF6_9ROSI|nr:hypothetical protein COLO4_09337 [Corchorus olitorius]
METRIVVEALTKENYESWKACMESYMEAKGLWKYVVEGGNDASDQKKAAAALHAIQVSCSPAMLKKIIGKTTAQEAWRVLESYFGSTVISNEGHTVKRDLALKFLKAIIKDDVTEINGLLDHHPQLLNTKLLTIYIPGFSPLDFAILCGRSKILETLVSRFSNNDDDQQKLSNEELKLMVSNALCYAVNEGGDEMINIFDCLTRGRDGLLTERGPTGGYPVWNACYAGCKDMITHVYSRTINKLRQDGDGAEAARIILYAIRFNLHDIALDLAYRCQKNNQWKHTVAFALGELASDPSSFPSSTSLSFLQRCIYSCLIVNQPKPPNGDDVRIFISKQLGIKELYDLKVSHGYNQTILEMLTPIMTTVNYKYIRSVGIKEVIINAVKFGITKVLVELIRVNPDILMFRDDMGRNIFLLAVLHRQEKVLSLIYGIGALRKVHFRSTCDRDGSTMLHLAGKSPPQRLIDDIQGPALLLQRELQWFEEVAYILEPVDRGATNRDGKTADDLFEENHREMVNQAEKWMKDIAQSSTVVGALIITVMFAALFTLPGGNNQDTGIPLFLHKKAFKVFILSDTIALTASSTSVLIFLGILTSRYSAKDFLTSLPTKFMIALFFLFISIATMMIAFCSAATMILKGQLSLVVPIIVLASIPVAFFLWLQSPILVTTFWSTYGPGIFDRKMKNWL